MRKSLACYCNTRRFGTCAVAERKRPVVFFGPSGCGKTTLINLLMEEFPKHFGFSVSHTTRPPRPGERNGEHYHFIDLQKLKRGIVRGKFIEYAVYSGHVYATSKKSVEAVRNKGLICVLDVDCNGVESLRKTHFNPWYVFIKPPSLTELEKRLLARKTETESSLVLKLAKARVEMEYGTTPGKADVIIVNDDLKKAYKDLREFIVNKVLK